MIILSKIFGSAYDKLKRRVFKVWEFGPKSAIEAAPFGDDGNPLQGMDAIYAYTSNDDEPVIIGYLNTGQQAQPGEKRIYSLKQIAGKPVLSAYVWLKGDGSMELNGKTDNAVRYAALNKQLAMHNQQLNAELTKIQAAITALGGQYLLKSVTMDISPAKIEDLKTT